MSSSPPRKKRKINEIDDDEYVPSDPEDEVSDYSPSDEQQEDELIPSTNSTSKFNDNQEESISDHDNNDEEDKDSDEEENDEKDKDRDEEENDENKPKLSDKDKKIVRNIFDTVGLWTATQLKDFLRNLKSLRSIDGESVFEDLSLGGKKEELHKRVRNNIFMVYLGQIVAPNKNKNRGWAFYRPKIYNDTIDFDGWKLQIQQFINVISVQSSKKSRKKKSNSVMNDSLISRLNACNKVQVISSLELLLQKQPNASDLAQQLEELLPRPNLEGVFKKHNVLINAISKARPWTRYGSSSDNYCFKRCRSSINTAKKAIIDDGKRVMDTGEYDICLEYLVVTSKNIESFPVWDDAGNNSAVRDLKKKLKVWHSKVVKALGKNVNVVQKKRLNQIETFLNNK